MAEYITKERAKDLIVAASSGNSTRLARVLAKLEEEPPADVAPVVHARWERFKRTTKLNGTSLDFRCSSCKKFKFHNGELTRYRYCPNCGARMDGDKE